MSNANIAEFARLLILRKRSKKKLIGSLMKRRLKLMKTKWKTKIYLSKRVKFQRETKTKLSITNMKNPLRGKRLDFK